MIRPTVAGDLPAILKLEQSVETAPHWSEAIWRETLGGGRAVFVAEDAGDLLGFVVGHEVAGVVEVESIAVSAVERRSGLGRRLMEALRGWTEARGANAVELEVRESNTAAIGFYAALGFMEQGRRAKYYLDPPEDAILMRVPV